MKVTIFHYYRTADVTRSLVEGTRATALCGDTGRIAHPSYERGAGRGTKTICVVCEDLHAGMLERAREEANA